MIDRVGAARCVNVGLALIATSFLAWNWAGTPALTGLVLVPWALGLFSSNSAQQARLSGIDPAFTPALLALNTSAIYTGQAIGAASGGAILTAAGYAQLSWAALAFVLLALTLSVALGRTMRRGDKLGSHA